MYQCCWWSPGNCCDTDNYFRLLSIIWTAVVIVMMMILFWWQSQMKNKRFKKYEMMKVWEKLHQQVTLVWMTMKTMKVLLWLRQWRWSVPRNKTDPRCAGRREMVRSDNQGCYLFVVLFTGLNQVVDLVTIIHCALHCLMKMSELMMDYSQQYEQRCLYNNFTQITSDLRWREAIFWRNSGNEKMKWFVFCKEVHCAVESKCDEKAISLSFSICISW